MAIDFKKHMKSAQWDATNAKYMAALSTAWMQQYPELDPKDVVKWDVAEKLDTMTFILAAEMSNGDLKNVECTKAYLNDAVSGGFKKPKPPQWKQMNTAFCEKSCEAFLMEAFGQGENDKPVLSLVGNKGKIMLCNYAGTCPACLTNFAKKTVIFYGIPSDPTVKPAAYHPGCFMKELAVSTAVEKKVESGGSYAVQSVPAPGAMRYALRSMGRTADEMRWRRRAKATCNVGVHSLYGGQDPTIPERHKWRCECPTAPWQLTKQQRQETRSKYGVKK